jgi:hypothetical protein
MRPGLSAGERAILAADKEIERAILAALAAEPSRLSANGQGRSENFFKSTLFSDFCKSMYWALTFESLC